MKLKTGEAMSQIMDNFNKYISSNVLYVLKDYEVIFDIARFVEFQSGKSITISKPMVSDMAFLYVEGIQIRRAIVPSYIQNIDLIMDKLCVKFFESYDQIQKDIDEMKIYKQREFPTFKINL